MKKKTSKRKSGRKISESLFMFFFILNFRHESLAGHYYLGFDIIRRSAFKN